MNKIKQEKKLEEALEKAEYEIYDEEVLSCLKDLELFDRKLWFTKEIIFPCDNESDRELQPLKDTSLLWCEVDSDYQTYKWDVAQLMDKYNVSSLEWHTLLQLHFLKPFTTFDVEDGDKLLLLASATPSQSVRAILVYGATGGIEPAVIYKEDENLILSIVNKK